MMLVWNEVSLLSFEEIVDILSTSSLIHKQKKNEIINFHNKKTKTYHNIAYASDDHMKP